MPTQYFAIIIIHHQPRTNRISEIISLYTVDVPITESPHITEPLRPPKKLVLPSCQPRLDQPFHVQILE